MSKVDEVMLVVCIGGVAACYLYLFYCFFRVLLGLEQEAKDRKRELRELLDKARVRRER